MNTRRLCVQLSNALASQHLAHQLPNATKNLKNPKRPMKPQYQTAALMALAVLIVNAHAQDTHSVDHKALVASMHAQNSGDVGKGEQLYRAVCINCHGEPGKPGTLPTALRFWEAPFKNGTDPRAMYRTLTKGFNQMVPQNWMTPEQKYQVIHYIRQKFLAGPNPSQHFEITDEYIAGLKSESYPGPRPRERQLRPYMKMDFGNNMNYTFEVGPDNIAYKAIAVRLDTGPEGIAKGNTWIAYDHDLMRVAAIWRGDRFINWRSIAMDGSHGTHPRIEGKVLLLNPKAPGWAKPGTDDFEDPRFLGRDNKPYGPLPRGWVHYKGLYQHGERILIDYTVGERHIHEMPGMTETQAGPILTRTFRIGPGKKDLRLQVAGGNGKPTFRNGIAVLAQEDGQVLAAYSIGGPKGTDWDTASDGAIRLRIPASKKATSLKLQHWRGASDKAGTLEDAIIKDIAGPEDLTKFVKGGPTRWPHPVATEGKQSDKDDPYVVDEITMPAVNPWNSWMRLSGFDFFEDGRRAAVSTWHGDVWIVEGLGGKLGKLSWKRIASGLFQPLGVRVIDGVIHLACRDQICVLHDLNGDGETDYYESLNSDHQVTEHFHEFAMGLQTDDDGNFYYAKSARHAKTPLVPHHGTLIKVSKDGEETEILATGFRAANGVCINPDGSFFVTDQEGHWTPKNRVNWVTKGGFYGNIMGYTDVTDTSDSAMQQPLAWITNRFNRSPGELVWANSQKWGPLEGSLLDISYGMGRVFVVLNEKVNGQLQGGEYALPIPDFPTGTMRGRFHKKDGQLYVCGMFAWAGNKNGTGGFYRIRYTGKPVCLPTTLNAAKDTLRLRFTQKLDPVAASSPASFNIQSWDLKRARNYGSKHYNTKSLEITGAKLLADGRTVEVTVPGLKPTWGMEIKYELKSDDGNPIRNTIHNTIHNLGEK